MAVHQMYKLQCSKTVGVTLHCYITGPEAGNKRMNVSKRPAVYIHVTCVSKTGGRIEEKAMAKLHSILLTAGFVL